MSNRQQYPISEIRVVKHRLQNLTGGMNAHMPQGGSVEFFGISGTITVGTSRVMYDSTMVVYHVHIDEVPWVIFSTLNDVLK